MLRRDLKIAEFDPELWEAITEENTRQEEHIELIASENYTSPMVMEAQGSQLTNKYAEGYPGKRYYGGCEYVDKAELLAIKRAKPEDGAKFGALVNIPINTVYSVVLCYLVGTLDACVLNGAPFIASIFGFFQNIIPVWIACFVVTFLLQGPIENFARKVCNDPVPPMGGAPAGK